MAAGIQVVGLPEGMEAQEVREEYQAVAAVAVGGVVSLLLMVLVHLVPVGRYGYGIGSSNVNVGILPTFRAK